jgi:TetR/AcrR family transcriptional regulator, regulator of cefoperazone and chloramphenicol sensitivity
VIQAKLLDIAVAEFGAKGLDGANTRSIAAAAGTAMSSITYHYRGKEGLYLAAADHIADQMAAAMADEVAAAQASLGSDRATARAAVQRLVARFADKMANPASDAWAMFIVREQTRPTEAFDRIYRQCMGPLMTLMAELICAATGIGDRRAATVAAITLQGQAVALRSSRASCLRLLDVADLSGEVLDLLKRRIAANTDAMLDRLAAEAEETA